jgi:hypothetical protein
MQGCFYHVKHFLAGNHKIGYREPSNTDFDIVLSNPKGIVLYNIWYIYVPYFCRLGWQRKSTVAYSTQQHYTVGTIQN